MNIWVDIANSPHVTLFRPVVDEIRRRGHEVILTAWDRGQTRDLAEQVWPGLAVVGDGFRKSAIDKATAIWARARRLVEHVRPFELDLALGHNSYSQIVAGRMLGIRVVTAMDYEHQPANHLAFRLAHRIILPDAVPLRAVRRFGAHRSKVVWYSGLKEEIALADFEPDGQFRRSINVQDDEVLVTVRPPAEGALYHRNPNKLFEELIPGLGRSGARVLLSPRTRGQALRYGEVPGVEVLTRGVSGPDLLYHSDVVIGAGGTMTREAAVLGTPTWTVFAGRPSAVDQHLISAGRLRVLDRADACPPMLRAVKRHWRPDRTLLDDFLDAVTGLRTGEEAEPRSSPDLTPAA